MSDTGLWLLYGTGIPHGEKEAKKALVIQQLSPEEIEKLKVACRVSSPGRGSVAANMVPHKRSH